MSIWGFLGGMADAGSKMLDDNRKMQFMQMQQDAELKRQIALKKLEGEQDLTNKKAIMDYQEKLSADDFKYVHPQPDGGLIGVKKDNSVVQLTPGNPKYLENQNALNEAKIQSMQSRAEAAMANAGAAGQRLEFLKKAEEDRQLTAKERLEVQKEKDRLNEQIKKFDMWQSAAKAVQNEYDKNPDNIGKPLEPEELNSRVSARLDQAAQYAKGGGMGGPTGIAPPTAQVPSANSMTPGASPSMPLPVNANSPKPPVGTWIVTPAGNIVQVK